jgi:hypothetical protein
MTGNKGQILYAARSSTLVENCMPEKAFFSKLQVVNWTKVTSQSDLEMII